MRVAGSGLTVINVPASYDSADDRLEAIFTFGKSQGGWNQGWSDEAAITGVSVITPRGQDFVDVLPVW